MDIEAKKQEIIVNVVGSNISMSIRDKRGVESKKRKAVRLCDRCKAKGSDLGSFFDNGMGNWVRICHPKRGEKQDCLPPEEEKINIYEQ